VVLGRGVGWAGSGEEECEGQGRGGKRGARGVVAGHSQLFVNFRVQNLTPRPASTVWTYTSISKKKYLRELKLKIVY
jgi:hypothetical protein